MSTEPIPLHKSFERRLVDLRAIKGVDPDVAALFADLDLAPDAPIDIEVWSNDALQTLALIHPPILRPRSRLETGEPKDYWAVANLGVLHSLQRLRRPPKMFPAQVATRRLFRHEKVEMNAVELLGMSALYRTRPRLPERLFVLFQRLVMLGIQMFIGDDMQTFRRATGFSLRSRKSTSEQPNDESDAGADAE